MSQKETMIFLYFNYTDVYMYFSYLTRFWLPKMHFQLFLQKVPSQLLLINGVFPALEGQRCVSTLERSKEYSHLWGWQMVHVHFWKAKGVFLTINCIWPNVGMPLWPSKGRNSLLTTKYSHSWLKSQHKYFSKVNVSTRISSVLVIF